MDHETENLHHMKENEKKTLEYERFNKIIETSIDAIISVNSQYCIIMINPAFEKMFGYSKQEAIGMSLNELIPHTLRHNHDKHVSEFKSSNIQSKYMGQDYNVKGVKSNGELFPIETSISKMVINGEIYFNAIIRDISQKKKFADTLKLSEEKFKTFTESSIIPILVIAPEYRIIYINKAGLEFFEYTKKKIFGMNFTQLIHPDSRIATENRYKKKIIGVASPRKNIMKVISKSGKIYDVESQTTNIKIGQDPAVLVSILDITKLKKVEKNLHELNEELEERVKNRTKKIREANEKTQKREQELQKVNEELNVYKTLLEYIPHVSWTGNADGQVTYLSKAWKLWTGREVKNSLGTKWAESIHPNDAEELLKKWENAYRYGKPYKGECRFVDQKNQVTHCSFIGIPVKDGDQKVKFWAGIDYNISELKNTQLLLQKANEKLNSQVKERTIKLKVLHEELEERVKKRTQKLEEINNELINVENELRLAYKKEKSLSELKSRFVSVASHQFRTPLTAIQSNAELLQLISEQTGGDNVDKSKKPINRILEEIYRMTTIMDDVLIFGKINANKVPVNFIPTDIMFLCNSIASKFTDIIEHDRKVNIEVNGSNKDILVDPNLLEQAVSNLLSNAIKYSEKDVLLIVSFKKNTVEIEITDFGLGIPIDEIKNLFQPFYRTENVSKTQGSGLGLSIAKEFVELIGGTIHVKSKMGIETTFIIVLPLKF